MILCLTNCGHFGDIYGVVHKVSFSSYNVYVAPWKISAKNTMKKNSYVVGIVICIKLTCKFMILFGCEVLLFERNYFVVWLIGFFGMVKHYLASDIYLAHLQWGAHQHTKISTQILVLVLCCHWHVPDVGYVGRVLLLWSWSHDRGPRCIGEILKWS